MARAIPPLSEMEVVLQIGVRSGDIDQVLERRGVQRRPSQIGVNNDPRCIDHPTEAGLNQKVNLSLEEGIKVFKGEERIIDGWHVLPLKKLVPEAAQPPPDPFDDHGPGMTGRELSDLRVREDIIDTRDLTQSLLAKGG